MRVLTKSETINTRIGEFKAQGKVRQDEAHLLAVSCLNHANDHGDVTLLSRLYHAFGKTENPNEFRYWVGVMSNKSIRWDKDNLEFKQRSKDNPVRGACDIEKAKATPWWDMEAVKSNRDFDPEKDVKGVVSTLKRHIREATEAGETELAEAYGKMLAQAEQMSERVKMLKEQASTGTRPAAEVTE